MGQGRGRKVRSDKKREVKAVLKIDLKDSICRLSNLTFTPIKDVCEQLCIYVLEDKNTIGQLAQYFKRDVRLGTTMYMGNTTNKSVAKRDKGEKSSATIKFKQDDYNSVAVIAYALDCTPSRATTLLLSIAMRNMNYVNKYIKTYLEGQLTESQMRELKNILKYANHSSDTHHSWASLLGHILDEVSIPMAKVKDTVDGFISSIKDN